MSQGIVVNISSFWNSLIFFIYVYPTFRVPMETRGHLISWSWSFTGGSALPDVGAGLLAT